MARTKGEQFAGVTVALVTPFRNGEVDFDGLRRLVDWHVEQGTDCLAPVGTTGESPTLDHEEHERVIAAVVEQAARPHQGHARHRLQQHPRGHPPDEVRQAGRGRRRPHGRPVLQQADAGRLLPPLRRRRRGRGPAHRALQHPRPHRLQHPARDDRPAGRAPAPSSPSRRRPARWTRRRRSPRCAT